MPAVTKATLFQSNTDSFPNNTAGEITPADLRDFNTSMITSLVDEIPFGTYTASVNTSISAINTFTASQQSTSSIVALNSFTASQLVTNTNLNQFTQSAGSSITQLNSYTASFTTSVGIYDEGVFVQNVNQINFSGNGITSSYVSGKAVVSVNFTPLNDFTASTSTQLTSLNNNFNSFTSSTNSKFAAIAIVTASMATTGSNTFIGNQFITGTLNVSNGVIVGGNMDVGGTITATSIITIYETASVIYSSGSNILGDSTSDTQQLNGTVYVSGALFVNGLNVTASVNNVNIATASLQAFTASAEISITNINTTTASLNSYTSSQNTRNTTLAQFTGSVMQTTESLNTATQSLQTQITTLGSFTGSYATTGSNTFIGNQTITGSLTISSSAAVNLNVSGITIINGNTTVTGSVYGNIISASIASATASMNLSTGNFFTLTLASGSTTRLEATNIKPGQTINLLITQPSVGTGSVSYPSYFKFPLNFAYTPTAITSSQDIITFISYDTTNIYSTAVKNLV